MDSSVCSSMYYSFAGTCTVYPHTCLPHVRTARTRNLVLNRNSLHAREGHRFSTFRCNMYVQQSSGWHVRGQYLTPYRTQLWTIHVADDGLYAFYQKGRSLQGRDGHVAPRKMGTSLLPDCFPEVTNQERTWRPFGQERLNYPLTAARIFMPPRPCDVKPTSHEPFTLPFFGSVRPPGTVPGNAVAAQTQVRYCRWFAIDVMVDRDTIQEMRDPPCVKSRRSSNEMGRRRLHLRVTLMVIIICLLQFLE